MFVEHADPMFPTLYITNHVFRSKHFSVCYQIPTSARWLAAASSSSSSGAAPAIAGC